MATDAISQWSAQQAHDSDAALIDVREQNEWDAGHAPDAIHVPLGELPNRLSDLPDGDVVFTCRAGGRSQKAAEFVGEHGRTAANLSGGMQAWEQAGLPVTTDSGQPGTVI